MGKLLKIIGGIIVVLVIVAIILPMVIDPNDYRDEIVAAVEKNTGRQLRIDGDMQLSVFPWLGISIGKLQLGNAKGFGDKPFAAIDEAAVHVRIWPLLSKRLEADTITLDGLSLNLAKNKQGRSNWDDLLGKGGEPNAEKTKPQSSEGSGLAALSIGGISINNANISWQDDSTGQSFQVRQFHLNSDAITPGNPVKLELGLEFDNQEPALLAKLDLDGTVSVDSDAGQLLVNQLAIKVAASGDMFNKGEMKVNLMTDVKAALDGKSVALSNLLIESGDLHVNGALTASNLDVQPAVNGNLKVARLNLREWLDSQGITLPPMNNAQALAVFDADIILESTAGSSKINPLKITLDQSHIDGSAMLQGQHSEFAINIDQINIDDYLPVAQSSNKPANTSSAPAQAPAISSAPAAKTTSTKAPATTEAELFPVELLKSLDTKGKLTIGKMIVSKLTSEDIRISLLAKNGKVNIDQQIGKFYQGSYSGKTSLDVAGSSPKLNASSSLSRVQAGPLIKDLSGQDKLSGTGNFNMDVQSSGNTVNAIKQQLDGKLDFRFENGAVKGVNLAQLIRETKAKFEGKTLPASSEPQQTDFSELSGSATITNGVLDNRDLLAKSPYLRVTGSGIVNLVQESLNYTVQTTIVASEKGQGGEELKDLQGLNIPVKLSGSYLAPDYKIDWGKVLLSSQKAKVDEKVEEKKQELKDKLKEKLGSKLKGLF